MLGKPYACTVWFPQNQCSDVTILKTTDTMGGPCAVRHSRDLLGPPREAL